jgi:hypothetical protein
MQPAKMPLSLAELGSQERIDKISGHGRTTLPPI